MIGSSASEEEGDEREWILQIDKHRSVKESFSGTRKCPRTMSARLSFQRLLEGEASFNAISVDPEP